MHKKLIVMMTSVSVRSGSGRTAFPRHADLCAAGPYGRGLCRRHSHGFQEHHDGRSVPNFSTSFMVNVWLDPTRGLQIDVVYLVWPIAPSYMSPNAGVGGDAESQPWVQLYTGLSPNKLWKSNSILILWIHGRKPCGRHSHGFNHDGRSVLKSSSVCKQLCKADRKIKFFAKMFVDSEDSKK